MGTTVNRELSLGPSLLYPAKAAATRARSLAWLARRGRGTSQNGIRVLFYHRVANERDELAVTPARFRRQLEEVARQGLRAVDVAEAARRLEHGALGGVVGLSFDDAYLDVAEHAEPVLRELGFTATVFVATGVTDGRARFPWYERQPQLIGWERMRELDRSGTLRFEPHTVTHPNLTTLSDDDARAEVNGSKVELEEKLDRETSVFCYPGGVFGEREERLVAAAGMRVAVSCEPGVNTVATNPFALRRIQIDAHDSLLDFRAKLGGGHDTGLPLRAVYRRVRYGSSSASAS